MEISTAEASLTRVTKPLVAYPTLKESWGVLGWYLLAVIGVTVPFLLIFHGDRHVLPSTIGVVLGVLANVILLVFLRWNAGPRWQPMQLKGQEQLWLYAALPVLVVAASLVLSLLEFLHLPSWVDAPFKNLLRTPVLAFGVLVIGAPVLEELLFRGMVLQGLLRNYRPWVAIGQSALVFGVMHFNPAQSLNAAVIGLLLGWLYYRTRSLWLCITVHALFNLLVFACMFLGPPAWEKLTMLDLFGSGWAYAGAVLTSGFVVSAILWRVWQTTTSVSASETTLENNDSAPMETLSKEKGEPRADASQVLTA